VGAVDAIVEELRDGGRCQIALATASGKTNVSVWAATALDVDQVLVLVPGLSLIAQTAEVWAADERWAPARTLAVCSDTGDLDLEATNDPGRVRDFLAGPGPAIVFATYQSSPVLVDAGCTFDLAVADEAHHLAGERDKAFAAIVRGDIRAARVLYMTATPRRFPRRRHDIELIDMDADAFGPRVYDFNLSSAVAAGVVSDYRVVVAAVEADVLERVGRHPDLSGVDPHLLAGAIAVVRAMGDYQLDSCISFHTRVDRARTFAQLVGTVAEALPELRPLGPGWAGFVHGDVSVRIRRRLLARLADGRTWGVIANAKALGEGIDLPALDAVAIVDPKNAEADVIQATGRALRKPHGSKGVGTVLLPVLLTGEADPDDPLAGIDARSLDVVSGVLRALRSHDAELGSRLDSVRRGIARHGVGRPDFGAALRRQSARALLRSRIELQLPGGAAGDLAGAMAVHLVRESTSSWEEAFGRLEVWAGEHGTTRVPQGEKVPDSTGTFSLGAWCTVQRSLRRRGLLDTDREARLTDMAGWSWDPREEQWWAKFDALKAFVDRHGRYPARSGQSYRDGVDVGQFVNIVRSGYQEGGKDKEWLRQFPDRVAALEALPDWVWNTKDAEWEASFAKLERFVALAGHAAPSVGDLVDGQDIGKWAGKQRARIKGVTNRDPRRGDPRVDILSPERTARLRALPGWVDDYWAVNDALWEAHFDQLERFVATHGRIPTQKERFEGYHLGGWVAKFRHARDGRRSTVTPERKARLESIPGWSWAPLEDGWNKTYELLASISQTRLGDDGIIIIPQDPVDGINLSSWATGQRMAYTRGVLRADRVAALEAIPGWSWTPGNGRRVTATSTTAA
jgi:superfamily II DNA or RNA helicase